MSKVKQVKPIKLAVIHTGDIWYCNDLNQYKIIDGVPFIQVSRQPNSQTLHMMRKDSLKKVQ